MEKKMDAMESFIEELKRYVGIQPVTNKLEKDRNHKFSFNGHIFLVEASDEDHFLVYPFSESGLNSDERSKIGFERNKPEKQKEAMWFFNKYAVCGKDDDNNEVAVNLTLANADKLKKTMIKAIENYDAFPMILKNR